MTDKSKGTKGISAFIVEKDTPGFTFTKQEEKMGIRATVQRNLFFENCRIPKANLLGKIGEGFKIAMTTKHIGSIHTKLIGNTAGKFHGCELFQKFLAVSSRIHFSSLPFLNCLVIFSVILTETL